MATVARAKAPAPAEINFGDLSMYVAGGAIPEGDYILMDFTVQMYQAPPNQTTGKSSGPARLGVMVTMLPLGGPYEDKDQKQQFYSLGTKAHESFAPNPETGKSLVAVPGGPAHTFIDSTNWAIFLKSLRDSGLPEGIFTNDVSTLDGIWVHIASVPEPASRAGMTSNTGEAAGERKIGTISVVTEIKDDGKPWENGGGVPEAAPATPAPKAGVKAAIARPAIAGKPMIRTAPTPAAAPAAPEGDEATLTAAQAGASAVLESRPTGCTKLMLRTGTFKAVKDANDADVANAVIEAYFGSDAALNGLLGDLGYKVVGSEVKPA